MAEKESEKGLMHSFFGEELCRGCKGMLVVAFIAPTQKDIGSFAAAFSRFQRDPDGGGGGSGKPPSPGGSAIRVARGRGRSSFVNSPKTGGKKPRK